MLRAVITGGAGFLGSHMCEWFLAEGYDVVCLDNFLTGSRKNVATFVNRSDFTLVHLDVSEQLQIHGPVDTVLHFASPASPSDFLRYPIETLKVGARGTHNALDLADAKGAKFLLASSSEVYGDPLVNPQGEEYWGNVNPVGPRSVYDEAKRYAESLTMAYHRVRGVDTRIARIFNTYGPRMRLNDGRAIPNFIRQALSRQPLTIYGNGKQTRSFCYVSDTVEGIWRLHNSDIHVPLNLGSPQEQSILHLAQLVRKLTGIDVELVFKPLPQDDPQVRQPNITRANRLLEWSPKVSLEEGLLKTIAYFRRELEI